jgi:methylenetetrahydrofolate dehydrogenase (NADP+)/methenyltetrahydrofolate cyclohydrolase
MQIIDGKKLRDEILIKIKKEVALLPFQPVFCDVLVGDDPASTQYVRMKAKTAESVGIKFHNVHLPGYIGEDELVSEIKKVNDLPNICGLIVQLPLPPQFDKQKILNAVLPAIDVDCLNEETSDLFYAGKSKLGFPTALACVHILDSLKMEMADKKIVVLGQGILVGKPVVYILRERGLPVEVITRSTEAKQRQDMLQNADAIISATGSGKIIKGEMLKKGVILIDAGTSESKGGIVGDVDLESVQGIASFISPVPGGVGPVTVAMLLSNVLQVAKTKKHYE